MLNLKKLLLLVGITLIALMLSLSMKKPKELTHPKELKLSDFPEVFNDSTLIIIGDEASEIELQAAKEIADYLEKETGNKPLIKRYSEVSDKDRKNNLIIVGTPKSNPMLKEIYAITDVLKVNETFPGEGKGVLEILRNPWDKRKVILLINSKDATGIFVSIKEIIESKEINDNLKITGILNYLGAKGYDIVYVKIKFTRIPSSYERYNFSSMGVLLLDYTPHNTFFAKVPLDKIDYIRSLENIESISPILIEDKIDSDILKGKVGSWAINPDGSVNIRVKFFKDVPKEKCKAILEKYGRIISGPSLLNYWIISINKSRIYDLALENEVQWIGKIPPPINVS